MSPHGTLSSSFHVMMFLSTPSYDTVPRISFIHVPVCEELKISFLLFYCCFFSQTENPNSERPYTFKDFLLHPRRLAWVHDYLIFCLSLFTFHSDMFICSVNNRPQSILYFQTFMTIFFSSLSKKTTTLICRAATSPESRVTCVSKWPTYPKTQVQRRKRQNRLRTLM